MSTVVHPTLDLFVTSTGLDPAARFRDALDKVGSITNDRPDAEGNYSSTCPAHNDDRPSLTWKQNPTGEIAFHCFAGCEGDEILRVLGLKWWEVKVVSQQYDYCDWQGTYLFSVQRTNDVKGGKTFTQKRSARKTGERDDLDGNGLEEGEEVFWLEPALHEWAEDLRASGQTGTLWLAEGEKDVIAIWGSGSLSETDFCTTTPGGAGGWKTGHTISVERLCRTAKIGQIVVICDPDPAGYQRGARVSEVLESALPDVAVRVVTIPIGKDVAVLANSMGKAWVNEWSEVTEEHNKTLIEEGTSVSGWVLRMPLGPGAAVGRCGLGMRIQDQPRLVVGLDAWPVAVFGDGSGWLVEVQGPKGPTREVVLFRSDLRSKAAFDKWLVEVAYGSVVPKCGVGAGDFAAAFAIYLDWLCEVREIGSVMLTRHSGWVDAETGLAARTLRDATRLVWLDGATGVTVYPPSEGDSPFWQARAAGSGYGTAGGIRYVGDVDESRNWGLAGSELDAAWAWTRVLTFGDRRSVAAVAGWGAAMVLAPWLGAYSPTKPGLAVIAPSGSGKTSGAARLLMGLCGGSGNMTASTAALRRLLSQGGVSSIRWIDDSSHIDDFALKEILRVATSQGDHVLSDADRGAGATQSVSLLGCVAVSAEGVAWLDETAMLDRFLLVHPENPQRRKSLMPGCEDELQWADVQDLIRTWGDSPVGLAGWTLRGLHRVATEVEEVTGLPRIERWVREVGKPRSRSDVGAFLAAVGCRAVRAWLADVQQRARQGFFAPESPLGASEDVEAGVGPSAGSSGLGWPVDALVQAAKDSGDLPGAELAEGWGNSWDWLVDRADETLRETRVNSHRFGTLVMKVLPTILRSSMQQVRSAASTEALIEVDSQGDADTFKAEVKRKLSIAKGTTTAMPVMIKDNYDGRIWVWAAGAAGWWERNQRGPAAGEIRVLGANAMVDQLNQVANDPSWSVGKGGARGTTGIQISRHGGYRVRYRRLNLQASASVLGIDPTEMPDKD